MGLIIINVLVNSIKTDRVVTLQIKGMTDYLFSYRPVSLVEMSDTTGVNQVLIDASISMPALSNTNMIMLGAIGGITATCLVPDIVSLFNILNNITITQADVTNLLVILNGNGQALVEQLYALYEAVTNSDAQQNLHPQTVNLRTQMFNLRRVLGFYTVFSFDMHSIGVSGYNHLYSDLYPYTVVQTVTTTVESPTSVTLYYDDNRYLH